MRLPKTMTMGQLETLLKQLPWARAKMIDGKVWLVSCGYVGVSYPLVEMVNKATLYAL